MHVFSQKIRKIEDAQIRWK